MINIMHLGLLPAATQISVILRCQTAASLFSIKNTQKDNFFFQKDIINKD